MYSLIHYSSGKWVGVLEFLYQSCFHPVSTWCPWTLLSSKGRMRPLSTTDSYLLRRVNWSAGRLPHGDPASRYAGGRAACSSSTMRSSTWAAGNRFALRFKLWHSLVSISAWLDTIIPGILDLLIAFLGHGQPDCLSREGCNLGDSCLFCQNLGSPLGQRWMKTVTKSQLTGVSREI